MDTWATPQISRTKLEALLGKSYEQFDELEAELTTLVQLRRETIQELLQIASKLDKHHKNVNISKMVGSSVGIIGGVTGIVGLGLIPVSFGISAIVAGVGAGVAALGGITSSGADVAEFGITRKLVAKAQKAIDADKRQCEKVKAL